jgi:hypothetical protein
MPELNIADFTYWAKNNGWHIKTAEIDVETLPDDVKDRYNIPTEYKNFLESVKTCINKEENIWFLCTDDYLENSEDAFRWNEFELISLEAADEDIALRDSVKSYWDNHLPIIMNVKDDYAYYAIDMNTRKIVKGNEPEFEETTIVADNFEEFIGKIIAQEIAL